MSPWVSLMGDMGFHLANDSSDIVGAKMLAYCGHKALEDVSDSLRVYLETLKVHDMWFRGIEGLMSRILVTAGGAGSSSTSKTVVSLVYVLFSSLLSDPHSPSLSMTLLSSLHFSVMRLSLPPIHKRQLCPHTTVLPTSS